MLLSVLLSMHLSVQREGGPCGVELPSGALVKPSRLLTPRVRVKKACMSVLRIREMQFEEEVLRSELPVLVDFVAAWCAPCKQLGPIVEEVASETKGVVKVVQVDIEECPMVAQAFRIQSVPMLVLVHQGGIAGQLSGLVSKAQIMDMLGPVIPKPQGALDNRTLWEALQQGRALPVDIRDEAAYARYRIPGAVHLDVSALSASLDALRPQDGRLRVLYSRSTDPAKEQAEALHQLGVQVAYLEGGFLHWEADMLEVEKGGPA